MSVARKENSSLRGSAVIAASLRFVRLVLATFAPERLQGWKAVFRLFLFQRFPLRVGKADCHQAFALASPVPDFYTNCYCAVWLRKGYIQVLFIIESSFVAICYICVQFILNLNFNYLPVFLRSMPHILF